MRPSKKPTFRQINLIVRLVVLFFALGLVVYLIRYLNSPSEAAEEPSVVRPARVLVEKAPKDH